MAIEGLGNIYGVPAVKKEHEINPEKRRNQKKKPRKDKGEEEGNKNNKERGIDIRI